MVGGSRCDFVSLIFVIIASVQSEEIYITFPYKRIIFFAGRIYGYFVISLYFSRRDDD
jgi:hypothetical protein